MTNTPPSDDRALAGCGWMLAYAGLWLVGVIIHFIALVILVKIDILFTTLYVLAMWNLGHFIGALPLTFVQNITRRNRFVLLTAAAFAASGTFMSSFVWLVQTAALVAANDPAIRPAMPFLEQLYQLFS